MSQYRRTYRRRNGRIRPKWFLEGSLGSGVPFVGGSKFRFGTKNAKRFVRRQAKQVALKSQETKEHVRKLFKPIVTSGKIHTTSLIGLTLGASGSERVGSRVFLCGLNMKFEMRATLPSTTWRMYVIKSPVQFINASVNASTNNYYDAFAETGFSKDDLYRNGDSSAVGFLNHDKIDVIASRTFKINARYQEQSPIVREFFWNVKLMRNYEFASQHLAVKDNYYLVWIAQDNSGVVISEPPVVGTMVGSIEQVYKDA